MPAKRKTHTSNEVKKRYNDKTYQYYKINLRKDDDAELIQYIEEQKKNGVSPSETLRQLFKK
ncbi:MAG: hypothetical protein IIW48_07435 [Clostridia bacterium]|nr:hypothetical protein [Clostridia bacterium]